MLFSRTVLSISLLGLAFASFCFARSALAGKMIFLSGTVTEAFEVKTDLQPETGLLTLDPKGHETEGLRVEIVSSAQGRSPASSGGGSVLKVMTLTKATSIQLASLVRSSKETLQIRIFAP